MEKFTQIEDTPFVPDEEVLYNGKKIDLIKYKDTEILKVNDNIAILPYFKDEASILMKLEYLPAYQYKNQDKSNLRRVTNYLTLITGTIKTGENPEQTIRRELFEDGIIINNLFSFEIEGPYFLQSHSIGQVYLVLLELPVNSYRQMKPPTDGSKHEKISKCIRVSIGDINQIVNNDLITKYLLTKLKTQIGI